MLHGAAWVARRDRASALVEEPQQRHLADWREQRTRRRAELAEKTARRQAEFTALLPAIAAQVAADVSAAVAAVLQATRAEPLKELDLAPTTTTTSIISESSTSIQMPGGSSSISTTGEAASASHDLDLPSAVPVTCSTDCPRRDNGSSDATASVAASVVLDVALDISAPTRCLTMEPSLGNESFARVLASAKSDMALAEHYDKSEEDEDNSVPLFQWDPGEKPMVLRDSVLSRDIAWPACVKKMNADLSGSRDYDQKSGYADTQTYAESDSVCSNIAVVLMPQVLDVIPVTTSADQDDPQDDQRLLSTEVIQLTYDNHFGLTLEKSAVQPLVICDMFRTLSRTLWSQILYVELLKNQFDCAGPINKQYLECLTACATTYPSMCATTHSNCLLSWDPGDKTKLSCSSDNAIAKYFCQHIYKELLQYLYKQYLESLVVFAPAYLPIGVVQVAYAVLLLEYFSVIQKNCQLQYGDVKWWSDFSTIDGNHRTKANVGCVITATHFDSDSSQRASVTDFKDNYVRHQQLGELFWYLFDNAGQFLISSAMQNAFIDRYGVTAVVSRLLILVMRRKEVELWPYFQSRASSLIQFLPWDPGQPWYGKGAKLSALEHGLVVMLAADSGLACFHENSLHELCSCSFEVGTILNWIVTLMALQPWPSSVLIPQPSWELFTLFLTLAREHRYTAWIWCYLDDMHSSLRRTKLSIPHPGMHISFREIWVIVYSHDARVYFQSKIEVQKYTILSGFITLLGGRAEAQRRYSCTRVLIADVSKYWNSCVIMRGTAVLLLRPHGNSTLKGPMEQWDPGIARTPDIFTQYFPVSCLIISTAVTGELALEEFYQDAYQLYTTNTALLHDHAHIQAAGSVINIIRPSLLDYLSQSYDTRHHCVSGSASFSWKLPCTCKLSSVWLLRDPGDSTHCSQNLQWQVAWSLCPTPFQTWFSYCTPGKVALYNSEQLQGHIQQPKIGDIQLLKVKLGYSVAAYFLCIAGLFSWGHSLEIFHYIAWDFRGSLLPKASLSIPWDPGGAEWSRLEGKPLSKEGGMLATLFPISFMGWTVGWTYWPGLGGSHRSLQLHIRGGQQRMTRLWNGRLRPPSFCILLLPVMFFFL